MSRLDRRSVDNNDRFHRRVPESVAKTDDSGCVGGCIDGVDTGSQGVPGTRGEVGIAEEVENNAHVPTAGQDTNRQETGFIAVFPAGRGGCSVRCRVKQSQGGGIVADPVRKALNLRASVVETDGQLDVRPTQGINARQTENVVGILRSQGGACENHKNHKPIPHAVHNCTSFRLRFRLVPSSKTPGPSDSRGPFFHLYF